MPTLSAFSVAQGYVSSDPSAPHHDEDLAGSFDEGEVDGMGEEAAERRRRVEEERRGRMCPICLGKPVAGRMTKCGHVSLVKNRGADDPDLLFPLHPSFHSTLGCPEVGEMPYLRRHGTREDAQVGTISRRRNYARCIPRSRVNPRRVRA